MKIFDWQPDRGFGFVKTPEGRAFLHATAVRPRVPRGADLNGRDLVEVKTETSPKGLRVKSAQITPLETGNWDFRSDSLSKEEVYFPGQSLRGRLYIVLGKEENYWDSDYGKPVIFSKELRRAREDGCPDELIQEVLDTFHARIQKWIAKARREEDKKAAADAARAFIKSGGLPEGQKVLIFEKVRPEPTQWLNDEAVELFRQRWDEFVASVDAVGENPSFVWATGEVFEVSAEVGHSYMKYTFMRDDTRNPIYFGTLGCGERSPHKGGRFGMVGANPNDPEFRNRD